MMVLNAPVAMNASATPVLATSAPVGVPPAVDGGRGARHQAVVAHGVQDARAPSATSAFTALSRATMRTTRITVSPAGPSTERAAAAAASGSPASAGSGDDVQKGQVQQQVDGRDRQHAADHGAGDVAAGLVHLAGKVDDARPPVVGVDHPLQRHDHRRQQRRARGERPRRWPARGGGVAGRTKQAPMSASSTRALAALVSVCAKPAVRMPRHCSVANPSVNGHGHGHRAPLQRRHQRARVLRR